MTLYCLVTNGVPGKLHDFEAEAPPVLAPEKNMVWLPYTKSATPAIDGLNERLGPYVAAVVEGMVVESAPKVALTAGEKAVRKAAIIAEIDAEAEAARLKFVTPGAAKAAVYLQKQAEAARHAADPSPAIDDYPLIKARMAATGQTATQVVTEWTTKAAVWTAIAAEIERQSDLAKAAVNAATTMAEIEAALAAIIWPAAAG